MAHRQHQPIGGAHSLELSEIVVDVFGLAAEIDGLPQEGALQPRIGCGRTELVGFRARKAGDAVGIVQTKALVDFWIGPEFRALPQLDAGGERDVEGLLGLRAAT